MNVLQIPNAVFFVGLVTYFWTRHCFIQITKGEQKVVQYVGTIEKLLLAAVSVAVLLLPLLYLFTPLLSFADYQLAWYVRWCGVAVMLLSLWLFWRSHVDLGKNWSVSLEIRENHEIVSNGVYRRIRHPMYGSIWLWGIAQGLTLGNWLAGWALLPAFAAMYFIRTPREERMMLEQFGDSYRQYSRQTGQLFPRFKTSVDPTQPTQSQSAISEPTLIEEIVLSRI